MLKSLRFWLGLLISIVCIYFSLKAVPLDHLARALGEINWLWIAPAYAVFFASYVGRVYRWQLLFTPLHARWAQVLGALSIGYLLSNILPARLGDLARAYVIADSESLPVGRSLSSVLIERLSDGFSVIVLLAILLPLVPGIPMEARAAGLTAAVTAVVVLAVLLAVSWQRERGLLVLHRIAATLPWIDRPVLWHGIDQVIDGLAVLRSLRILVGLAAWCLIVWLCAILLNWFVMLSMGLGLGPDAAALVLVTTSLVVIVPSSPGYIGVFHLVAQQTLTQVYGIEPARALAYAVVIHAFVYLSLFALGLFFLWRQGLSIHRLQKLEAAAD